MRQKKSQNAIEFLAMLSILLLIFIALFGFVINQFGRVLGQKDNVILQKSLEDVKSEVTHALFAPDGYTRNFYIQDNAINTLYNISIKNGGEIVVNDQRGNAQILFLKPEEYIAGNICTKQNQIIKSSDYGIGICCSSCNGTVPGIQYNRSVECKSNTSLYWNSCSNLIAGNNLTQIRVNCSIWMNAANFTLYNQTGNQILFENVTSTTNQMRNLSISWVSLTYSGTKLSAGTYNVSAVCYNVTTSYVQKGNFTIS